MLVGLKVQRPEALTWPQWRLLKSTEMKKKIFAHLKNCQYLNFRQEFEFLFSNFMRTTKINSSQVLLEKEKLENGAF